MLGVRRFISSGPGTIVVEEGVEGQNGEGSEETVLQVTWTSNDVRTWKPHNWRSTVCSMAQSQISIEIQYALEEQPEIISWCLMSCKNLCNFLQKSVRLAVPFCPIKSLQTAAHFCCSFPSSSPSAQSPAPPQVQSRRRNCSKQTPWRLPGFGSPCFSVGNRVLPAPSPAWSWDGCQRGKMRKRQPCAKNRVS